MTEAKADGRGRGRRKGVQRAVVGCHWNHSCATMLVIDGLTDALLVEGGGLDVNAGMKLGADRPECKLSRKHGPGGGQGQGKRSGWGAVRGSYCILALWGTMTNI